MVPVTRGVYHHFIVALFSPSPSIAPRYNRDLTKPRWIPPKRERQKPHPKQRRASGRNKSLFLRRHRRRLSLLCPAVTKRNSTGIVRTTIPRARKFGHYITPQRYMSETWPLPRAHDTCSNTLPTSDPVAFAWAWIDLKKRPAAFALSNILKDDTLWQLLRT